MIELCFFILNTCHVFYDREWSICRRKQIDYENFGSDSQRPASTFRDIDGNIMSTMTEKELDAAIKNVSQAWKRVRSYGKGQKAEAAQ